MRHSALFLLAMVFDYTQDSFAFAGIPRYPVSRVVTGYPLSRLGTRLPVSRLGTGYPVSRLGTRFAVSLVTTPFLLQSNDALLYYITHKFLIFSEYFVLIKILQSVIHHRQRKVKPLLRLHIGV